MTKSAKSGRKASGADGRSKKSRTVKPVTVKQKLAKMIQVYTS